MHTWKNLLAQDRKYESEDLHVDMVPQLDIYSFPNQIATLDIAIKEENEKLAALAVDRKKKMKPAAEEKKVNVRSSAKTKESARKEKDEEPAAGAGKEGKDGKDAKEGKESSRKEKEKKEEAPKESKKDKKEDKEDDKKSKKTTGKKT